MKQKLAREKGFGGVAWAVRPACWCVAAAVAAAFWGFWGVFLGCCCRSLGLLLLRASALCWVSAGVRFRCALRLAGLLALPSLPPLPVRWCPRCGRPRCSRCPR